MRMGDLDAGAIAAEVDKRVNKKNPVTAKNAETAAKREERLSAKDSAPAVPKQASQHHPQPQPTQHVDKSLLLDKIQMYRERFPQLKSRNKLSGKSTVEEVEDELHYCEQQLGQKDGHVGIHIFQLAMSGLEEVTANYYNPLGLNLTGLGQVARENSDQFTPVLDELVIKYATNMYVGPEMRLAMATATLVYTVHAANNGNAAMAQAMERMSKNVVPPPSAKNL